MLMVHNNNILFHGKVLWLTKCKNIIPCTGSTFIKFTKTATKCVANFKATYRHPPCNIKLTTRGPEDGLVVGDSVALGDPGQVGERGAFPMLKKCTFFLPQPSLHQSSLF